MADQNMPETNPSSEQVKARLLQKLKKRGKLQTQELDENACAEVSQPELFGESECVADDSSAVSISSSCMPNRLDTIVDMFLQGKKHEHVKLERQELKNGGEYLEVKRQFPDFLDFNKGGPLHLARGVILSDGTAAFQVLLKPHRTMKLFDEDDQLDINAFENLMDLFNTHHYFCVGALPTDFKQMSSEIHVVLKNKEHHKSPFERITSSKCQVWFKAAKNMSKHEKEDGAICQECKTFFRYVKRMNTRNASEGKGPCTRATFLHSSRD